MLITESEFSYLAIIRDFQSHGIFINSGRCSRPLAQKS